MSVPARLGSVAELLKPSVHLFRFEIAFMLPTPVSTARTIVFLPGRGGALTALPR